MSRRGRGGTGGERERPRKEKRGARGMAAAAAAGRRLARSPGNYSCRPDSITGSPLAAASPGAGPPRSLTRCRRSRGGRPGPRGAAPPQPCWDCGSRRGAGGCGPWGGPGDGLGRGSPVRSAPCGASGSGDSLQGLRTRGTEVCGAALSPSPCRAVREASSTLWKIAEAFPTSSLLAWQ